MRHYVILTVVIFGGLWAVDVYKFDGRNSQAAWQAAWRMPGEAWRHADDLGRNFTYEVQRQVNAAMSGH
jgi:hypothetical protein